MFKEKYNAGKALRTKTPRSIHSKWEAPSNRPTVETMIRQSNTGRLPQLVPIRHFRMSRSPFVFYRATASLMARDLSSTPASGIIVQACGDCHLMNFGGFATPERIIVLDINDFDETHPAPWEWDLKRLATSFVLAAREKGFSESTGYDLLTALLSSYRQKINEYSKMNLLDLSYMQFSLEDIKDRSQNKDVKHRIENSIRKANRQTHSHVFYKITKNTVGSPEIANQPPLIYHPFDMKESMSKISISLENYKRTLQKDRAELIDQYKVIDLAIKVVGVGSVGTRCYMLLLMNDNKEPLFLQVKEARQSVLEPYTKPNQYSHQGERVVQGQRIIQAASDIFLGWTMGFSGRHFYVRQLRDKKISPSIELYDKSLLSEYAQKCGAILARAHCKTYQGAFISGYIGNGDAFCEAIYKFAVAYADQTEKDHNDFMKAVRAGRLRATDEVPENI